VAKTLIDNGASLNLIKRKTFIEAGLNLKDLTAIHDMLHMVIPGQVSTPIGHIDMEVSCETGDNKRKEMLMFEVANFDIGYHCILGRSYLLKFMVVVHIAYATMKMSGPKGVTSIKANQRDTLACKNAALTHARRFGEKAAQEQVAKVAKTQGSSTLLKSLAPKPLIASSPQPPSSKKGTCVTSTSNQ
jgi:hypothetical protein